MSAPNQRINQWERIEQMFRHRAGVGKWHARLVCDAHAAHASATKVAASDSSAPRILAPRGLRYHPPDEVPLLYPAGQVPSEGLPTASQWSWPLPPPSSAKARTRAHVDRKQARLMGAATVSQVARRAQHMHMQNALTKGIVDAVLALPTPGHVNLHLFVRAGASDDAHVVALELLLAHTQLA